MDANVKAILASMADLQRVVNRILRHSPFGDEQQVVGQIMDARESLRHRLPISEYGKSLRNDSG